MAERRGLRIDPFVLLVVGAAALAWLLPASGQGAEVLSWVTKAAIFALFMGYGARLSVSETIAGLRQWQLHGAILGVTFVAFPAVGLAILALPGISEPARLGLAFLTFVPSTVQTSITFTSIARGNVAGAIVAATASNLLGVVLTPVMAIAVLPAISGAQISWSSIPAVAAQLLLPFVLGQLSRRWSAELVAKHRATMSQMDRAVVALVVYGAFSSFRLQRAWEAFAPTDFLAIAGLSLAMLAAAFIGSWALGGWLKFSRADRIALLFCGTKKSLATGVPIASVLFTPALVGTLVLPLMIFHQAQLMVGAVLARRLAPTNP